MNEIYTNTISISKSGSSISVTVPFDMVANIVVSIAINNNSAPTQHTNYIDTYSLSIGGGDIFTT